jgi:hypothetical protein
MNAKSSTIAASRLLGGKPNHVDDNECDKNKGRQLLTVIIDLWIF